MKDTDKQTSGEINHKAKGSKIELKLSLKQDYCATWDLESLKLNL